MNKGISDKALQAVKKKHRKQASTMQQTAIALHAQGMSKTEAARRAGYSDTTIRVPKKIFTSQAITTVIDRFKLQLEDVGLTTEYIAIKLKDMLEATKRSDKDYLTQLNALKMLKEILIDQEVKQKKETDSQPSRRITLEEFIMPNNSEIQAQQEATIGQKRIEVTEEVPINERLTTHIQDLPINAVEIKEESQEMVI